jgi:predicted phage terminase large subunit-like protein
LAALDELKRAMGSLGFAAQYQQTPIPIGGNLVKWSWFKFYDAPATPGPTDRIIVSWDTAMSSGELADYSACVVLLVRRETVYLLDVFRARLDFPGLKKKAIELHRHWRPMTANYVLITENKGSGMSLIQDLKQMDIHAIPITPDGDKVLRMSAQTAPIEAGAVLVPRHASWLEEFRRELLGFPQGRNNDQVDAFSQALKRAFAPTPSMASFGIYHTR